MSNIVEFSLDGYDAQYTMPRMPLYDALRLKIKIAKQISGGGAGFKNFNAKTQDLDIDVGELIGGLIGSLDDVAVVDILKELTKNVQRDGVFLSKPYPKTNELAIDHIYQDNFDEYFALIKKIFEVQFGGFLSLARTLWAGNQKG